MTRRQLGACGLILAALVSGCGRGTSPSAGTGAREATENYYRALLRQDWAAAYAMLDSASRTHCEVARFTALAQAHRRGLGFEPAEVIVRSCEEHGAQGVAHVVFNGLTPAGRRQYKDALTLHFSDARWAVVLPPNFGHRKLRQRD